MWLWNRDSEFTKWQHPAMWYVALEWHAIEFARTSAILEFYIWFPFPHITAVDVSFWGDWKCRTGKCRTGKWRTKSKGGWKGRSCVVGCYCRRRLVRLLLLLLLLFIVVLVIISTAMSKVSVWAPRLWLIDLRNCMRVQETTVFGNRLIVV